MRKPLVVAAVVAGVLALVRRRNAGQATATLWREATREGTPADPRP